jgi:hypothetical protein
MPSTVRFLAELPPRQLAPEPLAEVLVARRVVGVDGLVGPAVDAEVRLRVALEAEAAGADGEEHGVLEDRRADVPRAMGHRPGAADLDRQELHNR